MKHLHSQHYKEQIILGIFSTCIGVFTAWDLFIDASMGTRINHIILESVIVICSIAIFIRVVFLLIKKNDDIQSELNEKINKITNEAIELRRDYLIYKEKSQNYINGISVLIDKQFDEWQLSNSEKEVALLLLKGLSHKEIAQIRNTAEKTIRHQSGQVYSKSNLEGRAQLSAFFLEDLLLPTQESKKI